MKFKIFIIFFTSILALSVMSHDVQASITVGGVAPGKYQTLGKCANKDLGSTNLVTNFVNNITCTGDATKKFLYLNEHAWESDLLTASYTNIDDVDFGIFSGHGYSKGLYGIPYNSLHFFTLNSTTNFHPSGNAGEITDYANVDTQEIWWGYNASTKWMATFSCNLLNSNDSKWNSIMGGIHQVLGFASVMWVDSRQGGYFANDLLINSRIIKDAFFESCYVYQPANSDPVKCRVLGAGISEYDTIFKYSRKPATIQSNTDQYYNWDITVK